MIDADIRAVVSLFRTVITLAVYMGIALLVIIPACMSLGGYDRINVVFLLQATALIGLFFGVARGCGDGIPAILSVRRVSRFFGLQAFGRHHRGFRREVAVDGGPQRLIQVVDELVAKHPVVSRNLAVDAADWEFKFGGSRFRVSVAPTDRGDAVVSVAPVSRWIRIYMTAAEGLGVAAIGGILWRARQRGVASFDVESPTPPEKVLQDLKDFYEPRILM